LHLLAVGRDLDRKVRVPGDDLVQQALTLGTEVGDDDEAKAGPVRQAAQEAFQRVDTARQGADADDGEDRGNRHGTLRGPAGSSAPSPAAVADPSPRDAAESASSRSSSRSPARTTSLALRKRPEATCPSMKPQRCSVSDTLRLCLLGIVSSARQGG